VPKPFVDFEQLSQRGLGPAVFARGKQPEGARVAQLAMQLLRNLGLALGFVERGRDRRRQKGGQIDGGDDMSGHFAVTPM